MPASFVPIRGLHHYAYRCRDCEETRAFYEDLLGLPLVQTMLRLHGGEMQIESESGSGTLVRVIFPPARLVGVGPAVAKPPTAASA